MAKINPPWYHLGVSKLPQGVELRNFVLRGMPRQQQEHCVWEELKVSGGRQQFLQGINVPPQAGSCQGVLSNME